MLLAVLAVIAVAFLLVAALHDRWARHRHPERATPDYWEAARAERRELRLRRTFGR